MFSICSLLMQCCFLRRDINEIRKLKYATTFHISKTVYYFEQSLIRRVKMDISVLLNSKNSMYLNVSSENTFFTCPSLALNLQNLILIYQILILYSSKNNGRQTCSIKKVGREKEKQQTVNSNVIFPLHQCRLCLRIFNQLYMVLQ